MDVCTIPGDCMSLLTVPAVCCLIYLVSKLCGSSRKPKVETDETEYETQTEEDDTSSEEHEVVAKFVRKHKVVIKFYDEDTRDKFLEYISKFTPSGNEGGDNGEEEFEEVISEEQEEPVNTSNDQRSWNGVDWSDEHEDQVNEQPIN